MNAQPVNAVISVDRAFWIIFGASAVILVLITLATIYCVIRYNRKRHPVPATFDHSLAAEITWVIIPTLLVLAMFYYGWESFRALRGIPEGAMEVKVLARMWSWSFEYPNGRRSPELFVPVGQPVKLSITSTDVIHGFFAPAFRVKIDAVPGMTTYAWLVADQPGDHDIFCSVYCGREHAKMLSRVRAVSPEEFQKWLEQDQPKDGRALLEKHGCLGCHSLDGSEAAGPTLKDIKGRQVVLALPGGGQRALIADEEYLRQAILGAREGTVQGFEPMMPSYRESMPAEELSAILDFLLVRAGAAPLDGAKIAELEGCMGCHSSDGSAKMGPSFLGLHGGKTKVMVGGRPQEILVDDDYILQTLADPTQRPTVGYDPVMPAYPDLTAAQKQALLDYLKSLGRKEHHH